MEAGSCPKKTNYKHVMFNRKYHLRVLLGRCQKTVLLTAFVTLTTVMTAVSLNTLPTQAATNSNLNFQARLQTASGGIAADGLYNVEFKLYSASTGGSALWTETYLNSNTQGIRVKNGYLTTNLGSVTAFPGTINWDQDLWITMTVRGTGSCAFAACTPTDAEMTPRLKLTGVPYAFRAGQLAKYNSGTGFTSTLEINAPTGGNQTFQIADQGAAGTYTLLTQNAANASYIQNQTASPQTAGFNVSGNGTVGGTIRSNTGFNINGTAGATTTCSGGQFLQNATTVGGIVTGGSCAAASGGVTTVGTIDSQTKSANGVVISGTNIYMQTADATNPGLVSIGAQTFAGAKTFTGNVTTDGNLIEKTVTFTPTTVGWYRLATRNFGNDGGTVRIAGNYDNKQTDIEFQYNVSGYGIGNSIQQTRYSSYNNGVVSDIRISTDGAENTYLDIYVSSATTPGPITLYGYGPNMPSFVASPVVGATAGSTSVTTLVLGHGFRTTNTVTAAGTITGATVNATSGYQINGTNGLASLACTGGQLLQNATVTGGIVTAGSCVAPVTGGVTVVGTFSATSIANGASISGNTITLGVADATNPGMLSTTAQTIAGVKTFNNRITGIAGATLSGSNTNINVSDNFATNINTGTSNAQVSIGGGSGTFSLQTSNIDISTAGAITGATGITSTNTVQGATVNATTGYQINGTNGLASLACTGGQLLQNATVTGGIVTAGSCVAPAGGGVTVVGTLDSQTKSANGAVIAGTTIYLQTADATNPGLVSTGTQALAGAKTFADQLTVETTFAAQFGSRVINNSATGYGIYGYVNNNNTTNELLRLDNSGGTAVSIKSNGNITSTGSFTGVGVDAGSGLLQGSGGLTVTGTTNVNASANNATNINTGTSTGLVSIGGGAGTFALNTTNIDISAAGAITGATGITSTGTVQGTVLNATGNITAGGYLTNTLNTSFTNMIRNGSAENGTTYWSANNGGVSDAVVSAYASDSYVGPNSLRYLRTAFSSYSILQHNLNTYLPTPYFDTNKTYTLSFHVKSLSGTPTMGLAIQDPSATNTVTTCSNTVLSASWQQVTCTFTPLVAGTSPVVYITANSPAAVDILVDGMMLTTGSQAFGYTSVQADRTENVALNNGLTVAGTYNTNTFTSSALTFGAASAAAIQSASGQSLTIDSGTTAALNVGTGANAKTITIGNATGATSIVLNAGTGGVSIGANGIANTLQLGNTTGAVAQTINLGNNATASSTTTLNIGSTIGTSTTNVRAGSGGINVIGNTNINVGGTGATNIGTGSNTGQITIGSSGSNNLVIQADNASLTALSAFTVATVNATTMTLSGVFTQNNSSAFTSTNGATSFRGSTIGVGDATTDRATFTAQITGASPLVFQGATDNSFTTTLAVTDPTANNTITLPNQTGTVVTSSNVGSANQCLKSSGSATTAASYSACGTASTLQDAYDGSGGTTNPHITLATGASGLKIRDNATPVSGNLFQLQNSGGTVTYFGASTAGITIQNASAANALVFTSSDGHLKIYNPSNAAKFADIYYDNTTDEAVYSSSGTTRVGNGNGNITLALSNVADVLTANKASTLSGAYSATDFSFTRTIVAGSNVLTGSVFNVESLSTGSNVASTILRINENNNASTGNLIVATKGGAGNDKFKVDTGGTVTVAAGQSYTGAGATTLSSGAGTALTVTGNAASTVSTTAGALTLTSAAAATWSTSAGVMTLSGAAGVNITGGTGNVTVGTANATGTLLVLDTKNDNTTDPTGVNGGMYYNSTAARFRCYEGGVWKNCIDAPSNASVADQVVGASTTTYLTGSAIPIPAGGLRVGTQLTWKINVTKTAASTAALTFNLRFGTAGTTADTARLTFTTPANTAVVDTATITIMATVRSVNSSTGVIIGNFQLVHSGATATGFLSGTNITTLSLNNTSAGFNNTVASSIVGISVTTGASHSLTFQQVQATSVDL